MLCSSHNQVILLSYDTLLLPSHIHVLLSSLIVNFRAWWAIIHGVITNESISTQYKTHFDKLNVKLNSRKYGIPYSSFIVFHTVFFFYITDFMVKTFLQGLYKPKIGQGLKNFNSLIWNWQYFWYYLNIFSKCFLFQSFWK